MNKSGPEVNGASYVFRRKKDGISKERRRESRRWNGVFFYVGHIIRIVVPCTRVDEGDREIGG
jgi:hypothetical protein